MEITRQIINTAINIAQAAFVNADNTTRSLLKPVLFAGNKSLFTCQLFAANGVAQALPENTEFYASLDNTYGPNHADLVAVTDELFNIPEDWDDMNLAAGRFCFRLTTATQGIIDALATQPQANVHLEIHFRVPGEDWAILLHETLTLRNTTADFLPVSSPGLNSLTTADGARFSAGATADRPTGLTADHVGKFVYIDTDLNLPIFWSGAAWMTFSGMPV